ncbi:hypothetical protein D0C36_09005 [Mucilaginibacter conchicola]|uniref:Fibronectin type-III domain-containing protein n=1 Tax=Mucilaginibacter conchicola TaxID=2303333 RepID=A0A372P0G7_9SPHI|nr:hypothetical protein [Mucilaginibacter conchicola]RFZ95865.1 hypothetical protein D0C36_09005 [Mucilaginibacter conchicola]
MKRRITLLSSLSLSIILGLSSCLKHDNTVIALPQIVTNDVIIDATSTQAWAGGVVINQGAIVNEYGVCYSTTNQEPTISDIKSLVKIKNTSFIGNLKGLTPNTTYYLRAYATNQSGTVYGAVVQFKTSTDMSNAYGTVSTFAGSAEGNADGTGTAALFNHPFGTARDAAGNLYVSDSYNCTIRKITADGVVTTIAGTGGLGSADGTGTAASFYSPAGLAVDANGNIFVADMGNSLIRKITPAGVVTTFAGSGNTGYQDGTGTAASFSAPTGIAIAANGVLYVSDSGTGLIRRITPAGVVTTIAGNRVAAYKNASGTDASFNKPAGIAVDATGNIYVAEPANKAIRKINLDNVVTTFAGGLDSLSMPFGAPQALSVDANNNIFVADGAGRVLKINKDHILTVMAGKSAATGNTDGEGSAATFNYPKGIVADNSGNVFVTDFNNSRIRKVK